MVYLAELLVVMTDGLEIVRIHPWNVPHKRLWTTTHFSRKATVSRAIVPAPHSGGPLFRGSAIPDSEAK